VNILEWFKVNSRSIFDCINVPELYDFQVEAVGEFLRHGKGIIVLPSGTGKSIVALAIIKALRVPTAIIVPTRPLLSQWVKMIKGFGGYATPYYGEEKRISQITVFTYATAYKNVEKIIRNFKFIVFDEVHHLMAEKYRALVRAAVECRYALGLTSTPERLDGEHIYMFKFLPLVYRMRISEAMARGFTSPLNIVPIPVSLDLDEHELYRQYTETILRADRVYGTHNPAELAKIDEPLARAALSCLQRRKVLLSEARLKVRVVADIVSRHLDERVLLFSESIRSLKRIKRELDLRGIKSLIYHSRMSRDERAMQLEKWGRNGWNILLSCRCLDEGINVPEVRIGVIVCTGKTSRQLIQRVGRLIRPLPGKIAVMYIVYARGTVEDEVPELIKGLITDRRRWFK